MRKPDPKPLSRESFREAVMRREGGACACCKEEAVDAHHIFERRLWEDGGYYLENGVALCGPCHMKAESGDISAMELSRIASPQGPLLPPCLEAGLPHDKWGNQGLPDGTWVRGPLFSDPAAKKAIAGALVKKEFRPWQKYPRTPHLPWSEGVGDDDQKAMSCDHFEGVEIVVTETMDGENTTGYPDHFHARSVDSASHPSQSMARAAHAKFAHDIPDGWRICCENVFALHSIGYSNLPGHLLLISVWDESNTCLSWDDTVLWSELLSIPTVPVLWRGTWDEATVRGLWNPQNRDRTEGLVVRAAESFGMGEFSRKVAKFVRRGHVNENDDHWKSRPVVKNSFSMKP